MRILEREAVGVYLAVLSILAVGELLSSLGLYSFVQRYVPRLALTQDRAEFKRSLIVLFSLRIVSLGGLLLVLLVAWEPIARWQGWRGMSITVPFVLSFVFFEAVIRFMDAIFESLVQQGYSQTIGVLRNLVRVAWLGCLLLLGRTATIDSIFVFEALVAAIFVIVDLWVLGRLTSASDLRESSADSERLDRGRAVDFSLRGYLALAIGQLWGQDTLRLIVGNLCGPSQLAVYGLAHALAEVVKRYMPVQLLLGFVRSVMVVRYEQFGDSNDVVRQGALLYKLNMFFLTAVAGWTMACGSEVISLATGRSGFGESGDYLAGFLVLVYIQALRMVLGIVAVVREDNQSVLRATLYATLGILVAWISIPKIGPWGGILATFICEAIYVVTLCNRLTFPVRRFLGSPWPYAQMIVAAILAVALVHLMPSAGSVLVQAVCRSIIFIVVFLGLLALLRPFSADERQRLNRLLPFKVFIW